MEYLRRAAVARSPLEQLRATPRLFRAGPLRLAVSALFRYAMVCWVCQRLSNSWGTRRSYALFADLPELLPSAPCWVRAQCIACAPPHGFAIPPPPPLSFLRFSFFLLTPLSTSPCPSTLVFSLSPNSQRNFRRVGALVVLPSAPWSPPCQAPCLASAVTPPRGPGSGVQWWILLPSPGASRRANVAVLQRPRGSSAVIFGGGPIETSRPVSAATRAAVYVFLCP